MAVTKSKKKSPNPVSAMPACDMDWRARDDMQTLRRADEIRADKSRVNAAKKEAVKDMKALERIAKTK